MNNNLSKKNQFKKKNDIKNFLCIRLVFFISSVCLYYFALYDIPMTDVREKT